MSLRRSARVSALSAQKLSISGSLAARPKPGSRAKTTTTSAGKANGKTKRSGEASDDAPPSTPPRKKRKVQIAAASPHPLATVTATPSAARLMAAPRSSGDLDDASSPPVNRAAEPHATNAVLISPETSRVVSYPDAINDTSPSKPALPKPSTTTGKLLEEACAHLIKMDPKLEVVIKKHPCRLFSPERLAEEIDPFRSLVTGIIAQQVSGAAANSIKNKFVALFDMQSTDHINDEDHSTTPFPTPSQVAGCDLARLRTAGLSGRKAEYIKGLAEKFVTGDLSAEMLIRASDEEVLEKLTAVRGLGRWSVEMFACFGLKRMDVFSTGDLGVQRGMAAYLGKDVSRLKAKGGGKWKYLSEKDMLEHSAKFAPYRSLFMWYMWRIEDINIDAIQNQ
ncbi:MAG: hypothetical protein M1823_004617 [Watsoniomyces obsoletus]|nr:MAG: hypothetical protein M1823_004617 [Watsoniomyces obsoletus]